MAAERIAEMREADQFLVSYPRSGNTWTRHLIFEILVQQRPDLPRPEKLKDLLPTMHDKGPLHSAVAAFSLPVRVLKSHNIAGLLGRRMIYLFRDPADTLVSYSHFQRRNAQKKNVAYSERLSSFCKSHLEGWIEHLRLGLEQLSASPDDTYLLAYETLHRETAQSLRGMVDFLGLRATDAELASAIERSSFERLRTREVEEKGANVIPFYRKGAVGSAAEELSPALLDLINKRARPLFEEAMALSRQSKDPIHSGAPSQVVGA